MAIPRTDQIPRLADYRSAAAQFLYDNRRRAYGHLYSGRYGDPVEGWVAQAAICRSRLADELRQSRLTMATEDGLRELVLSEYFAILTGDQGTAAIGEDVLVRPVSGNMPGGVIPAGTKIFKTADDQANPPILGAEYTIVSPAVVQPNSASVIVLLECTSTGEHGNAPYLDGDLVLGTSEALFDPAFTVYEIVAGGGSIGLDDKVISDIGRYCYLGRQGPNDAAILAGVLTAGRGVRHAAYFHDPGGNRGVVYVADASWGWSGSLTGLLAQDLRGRTGQRQWLGFGACVDVLGIQSVRTVVHATVQTREPVNDAELQAAITKACHWYFDERPGWWTYTTSTLAAAICRADRRIVSVPSVSLTSPSGTAIAETVGRWVPWGDDLPLHYYLVSDGVRLTVQAVS
jgi:hypothetical protein